MSVAGDLIAFIAGLTLAGGDHDGKPFTVLPWERRFIYGIHRVAGDSALSIARGNGKSALVAAIAAALVDPVGPLHRRRAEVVCVAASFAQGRIIFEDVLAFLQDRYNLEQRSTWRQQDSQNAAILEFRASGARVRCVGSDPAKAHGLRPSLVLADEPAQWDPAKAERMLSALRTGLGKVSGSRLVALGTRPADEGHFFSRMLRTADYRQLHAARPDDPPFRLRTIRRANPSHDHLPSLAARIQREIRDAKIDPDALASYRALRLNQGVADVKRSVLLDAGAWTRAEGLPERDQAGPYVLGIDLGTSAAMSAAAAYFESGALDAVAIFPRQPDLRRRGLADGVGGAYLSMNKRGELHTAGEHVADLKALLTLTLARWGPPSAIVADRWREAELRQALASVRYPTAAIVIRGQGYRDGGEDVRGFRSAVLGGHVRPTASLLLTAAMSEARTLSDPAGNEKLAKGSEGGRRMRARDDAAAAAILAVAAGYRQWHAQPGRRTGGAYIARIGP